MAGMLSIKPGANFVGRTSLYQFVNQDGKDPATACGQCAIATALANRGNIPTSIVGLRAVEAAYPADVFFGLFGTSPGRIRDGLKGLGLIPNDVRGKHALRAALGAMKYCITLIQNTPGVTGLFDGAHWFVVFGADDDGVHVTNYGATTFLAWSSFDDMWSSIVPWDQRMSRVAITA